MFLLRPVAIVPLAMILISGACTTFRVERKDPPPGLSAGHPRIAFVGAREGRDSDLAQEHQSYEKTTNVPVISSPYGTLYRPQKSTYSVRTGNIGLHDAEVGISMGLRESLGDGQGYSDISMSAPEQGTIPEFARWAEEQTQAEFVAIVILKGAKVDLQAATSSMTNKSLFAAVLGVGFFVCPPLPLGIIGVSMMETELASEMSGALVVYDTRSNALVYNDSIAIAESFSETGFFDVNLAFDKVAKETGRRFGIEVAKRLAAIRRKHKDIEHQSVPHLDY